MATVFNEITIDGDTIYRGNDFTLVREYLYAGEIETCTGKRCADLIGWRYADMTIAWDALPESQLQDILSLSGEEVTMTFEGEDGTQAEETVIPTVISSTATRSKDGQGNSIWKGISLGIRFTGAHRASS